jgi:hypothetical protein
MSLESAEKLVERILRQLGVPYDVEPPAQGETGRIVADAGAVATLPPELHPYITPRAAKPLEDADGETGGAEPPSS